MRISIYENVGTGLVPVLGQPQGLSLPLDMRGRASWREKEILNEMDNRIGVKEPLRRFFFKNLFLYRFLFH